MTFCKDIDDVEIGKIYTIDCSGLSHPIPDTFATQIFIKKYPSWDKINGKRILVLEKTFVSTTATGGSRIIKFAVFPINDPKQNRVDDSGEWCFCTPSYLYKQVNKHANCTCNLWTTGCVCGIFKSEKNKKK